MKRDGRHRDGKPGVESWRDEKPALEPGETAREDSEAVIKYYNLRSAFPPAVLKEAKLLSRGRGAGVDDEVASGERLDLRKKFVFTCDPVLARDYDDAISLERDGLGRRVLGVHIADVSHYVAPGGAIDTEAYKRGTSVYLTDRVLPMLPEELSNGLCSLVPGKDRLTFSVFMTFNRRGEMVKAKFAKTVIRSQARFTYEEVMGMINDGEARSRGPWRKRARAARRPEPPGAKVVREVHALAQQLRLRRFLNGAIDLETPEMRVILDSEGEMTGLEAVAYDESHQMIEECMVAANEAVAKELKSHGIDILSRYHPAPDPDKLLELRRTVQAMGVKCGNIQNKNVFLQFLRTIKGDALYPTLAVLVLRSMQRANYDGEHSGHWGLGKEFYAHFTSPIRRYPDLTLHRQLATYLETKKRHRQAKALQPSTHVLQEWASRSNQAEQRAAEAERALVELKKYRVLENEIASGSRTEYDGIISKVEPFGCFVEIPALAVSGLLHVSALSRSFVKFNESDLSLSDERGGSWRPGTKVRVVVNSADYSKRHIDFLLADPKSRRLPRSDETANPQGGKTTWN